MPQEASMIVAGGLAMAFHFACSVYCKKRCDPGRLILFAGSTAAVVAGVYVFFQALNSSLNPANEPVGMQNAVWAAIGGLGVAFFTLDFIINEVHSLFRKPVEPRVIDHISDPSDQRQRPADERSSHRNDNAY